MEWMLSSWACYQIAEKNFAVCRLVVHNNDIRSVGYSVGYVHYAWLCWGHWLGSTAKFWNIWTKARLATTIVTLFWSWSAEFRWVKISSAGAFHMPIMKPVCITFGSIGPQNKIFIEMWYNCQRNVASKGTMRNSFEKCEMLAHGLPVLPNKSNQ